MNLQTQILSDSSSESNSHNSEQFYYTTILMQLLTTMTPFIKSFNKYVQEDNQKPNPHNADTKQLHNQNCTNYDNINTTCNNTTNYTNLHLQNNSYPTNYSPSIVVSQNYILNNAQAYGQIIEQENEDYVTIKLYRHKVALTLEEIEISKKIIHPIDTQKQSMYRCPLKSCQHKPLNNLYIRKHIQEHCNRYHFNNKENYKFLYQINEEWKTSYYPPRPTIIPPVTNK